jgi:hypothetical protein
MEAREALVMMVLRCDVVILTITLDTLIGNRQLHGVEI